MTRVAVDSAARAAGLAPDELTALEDAGKTKAPVSWDRLAAGLGLDASKLERFANGWTAAPVDLGQWRELRPITTSDAGITVNCYLVWDEVTREAALFDTGWKADPIFSLLEQNQLQLKHLFLTHTHDDHIAAMGALRERYPKLHLHTNSKSAPPQHRNRANDFIHLGSLRITNRDTPGHADDGVTYIVGNFPEDAPNIAIVGDAIFAGSIGGAEQHPDLAKQKIQQQIFTLPPSTLICPGHGPLTTVAEQKAHNPFFA
jgi:glyoxylase-like metal-dependent hydrolase (beta-lactamase superfamily II)